MVEHNGYELILGCSPDQQLGPVLLFGAGGQQVELIRGRPLGLPPLNTTLAPGSGTRCGTGHSLQGFCRQQPSHSTRDVDKNQFKQVSINLLLNFYRDLLRTSRSAKACSGVQAKKRGARGHPVKSSVRGRLARPLYISHPVDLNPVRIANPDCSGRCLCFSRGDGAA